MAKKKASLKSPKTSSLKSTGLTAGGALAGFLLAQLVANSFPQVNDPYAEGAQALGAGVLHASIDGNDEIAELAKGASLGYALYNFTKLGQRAGTAALFARDEAAGTNGVSGYDLAAKALLPTDLYMPIGSMPSITPALQIEESLDLAEGVNSPYTPQALNQPGSNFAVNVPNFV